MEAGLELNLVQVNSCSDFCFLTSVIIYICKVSYGIVSV